MSALSRSLKRTRRSDPTAATAAWFLLNPWCREVARVVRDNPQASLEQIMTATDLNSQRVQDALGRLMISERVEWAGDTR